jgi:hypothetical protein
LIMRKMMKKSIIKNTILLGIVFLLCCVCYMAYKKCSSILPMGRMYERTDYLDGLVYMMSDGSAVMTGSTFRITAGEYI